MRFVQRGLAAALLVSAMACSSSSTPNAGSTGSTHAATTSSGPSTTTDPKAAAQAALDAYWVMLKRLYAEPNPNDAEISERAVDPSASTIRDQLSTRQKEGVTAHYDGVPYTVTTSITGVDDHVATFAGCIVDGAKLVNASGEVVDDKVSTSRVTGLLVLDGGAWKVSRFDVIKKADGEVSCDALA
jgi:hypothetical protein